MPGKILAQVLALPLQSNHFFLRTAFPVVLGGHGFEFFQALDRLLHRQHVGEQPAQPALIDIVHAAARRFLGNGFLRLPLGSDEQNRFAARRHLAHVAHRVFEQLQSLLQIYNVDPIAFAKDVFFHLWIPALGLVPEMNACFEQFLHANRRQKTSYWFRLGPCRGPKRNLRHSGLDGRRICGPAPKNI